MKTTLPLFALFVASFASSAHAEWYAGIERLPSGGQVLVIESGYVGMEYIEVTRVDDYFRISNSGSRTDRWFLVWGISLIRFNGDEDTDVFIVSGDIDTPLHAYGNGGDDWIEGGGGDDALFGGTGIDNLFGHGGNDNLHNGEDYIEGFADGGGGTDNTFDQYEFEAYVISYWPLELKPVPVKQQIRANRVRPVPFPPIRAIYEDILEAYEDYAAAN